MRDYGHSRTSDAERLRLGRRHAGWYHQMLVDAETQWFGPQQIQWILRLTREMPNIREALQFSLTNSAARAADMVAALRRYWVCHAGLSEGCQWASRALAAVAPEPSVQRIRALYAAAHLNLRQGEIVLPASWIAEARELLESVDDPVTRGRINFYDGYTALITGDFDNVRGGLQRAMAATDDFEVQAQSMSALSWVDMIAGDASGALAWADKCLALAEFRGDWAVRAVALGSVGAAHWRSADLKQAEQVVRQGLQLALQVNDKYAIANGLEVLAWIAESRDRPRQTALLMGAAAEISRSSGARLTSSFVGGFHTECERRVRERLSAEEFRQAWAEGTALNGSGIAALITAE